MTRRVFVLLFVICFTLFFSFCSKVESNIQKMWILEKMTNSHLDVMMWDFKEEGLLIRTVQRSDGTVEVDTCEYKVQKNGLRTELEIAASKTLSRFGDCNGVFRVDHISEDLLKLTRYELLDETIGGAFLRREFVKGN